MNMINCINSSSAPTASKSQILEDQPLNGERVTDKDETTTGDCQIQLSMDVKTYALLVWLKGALEAASMSEVVRRAIQAYELFEPVETDGDDNVSDNYLPPSTKRRQLHVRIPIKTMERMEREKHRAEDLTYSDVVARSLMVLAPVSYTHLTLPTNREA